MEAYKRHGLLTHNQTVAGSIPARPTLKINDLRDLGSRKSFVFAYDLHTIEFIYLKNVDFLEEFTFGCEWNQRLTIT